MEIEDITHRFDTDVETGLRSEVAQQRLDQFGTNEFDSSTPFHKWRLFLAQFRNPLVYILLASAVVTVMIGNRIDAAVIAGVVLINAAIGFIQEWRAGVALAALARMTSTVATVIRSGRTSRIPSALLVPGDVVVLQAGDRVPSDVRLALTHELEVDEASLTGESVPVHKQPAVLPADTAVADQCNMCFSGTLVTAGRGQGITVATGATTQMGRIRELVAGTREVQTPLTRKLTRFSQWLTGIILGLAVITFGLGLARGETPADMVTAAVALAVGAIPEGLPAAVTITLAIGVGRMARRNAIVRHLPAVETLGSTTVICTDKTGTLTENRMTVHYVFSGGRSIDLLTDHPDLRDSDRDCLLAGVLCNDSSLASGPDAASGDLGDPTERALIAAADPRVLQEAGRWRRIQEIPFSSELRFMATLHEHRDTSQRRVIVKGAVEDLLALSDMDDSERLAVLAAAEDFGSRALRVMAFAWLAVPTSFALNLTALREQPLRFLGLQAMLDPPRPEAIAAVQACHTAGIDVKMITGDHRRTAEAIARQIGLHPDSQDHLTVLSGAELSRLDRTGFNESVSATDVFARVTAEQKLDIVRALQASGGVVAMTGDGVNDAPALKQADIGVAMGQEGTEVAKETADIILTDDDFATIESAVEEGRGVFDNLTKFITWTLPTDLGEGLVVLVAILLGTELPILPVQILWINMTTAVALGVMLALEPKEPGVMTRPPRLPDTPIVTPRLLLRIVLVGTIMLAGSFTLFAVAVDAGASSAEARTMAVNAFFAMEIGYLFNCRSLYGSIWTVGWFSNKWIWIGIGLIIVLQLTYTYAPFMNTIFSSAPLPADAWLPVLALGVATSLVVGAVKWWEIKRDAAQQSVTTPSR